MYCLNSVYFTIEVLFPVFLNLFVAQSGVFQIEIQVLIPLIPFGPQISYFGTFKTNSYQFEKKS